MSQPTRMQTTVAEMLGILLKTSNSTIIQPLNNSSIGALRSDAQSSKANFNPLNHFGFHL